MLSLGAARGDPMLGDFVRELLVKLFCDTCILSECLNLKKKIREILREGFSLW